MSGAAPSLEPLITPEEAAEILGMSLDWIYQEASAGRIPSYKLGGKRRFRASELEAFIQQAACGRMATVTPIDRERRR